MTIKSRFDLEDWTDEQVKQLADSGNYTGIFEYACRMETAENYKEAFAYFYKIKDFDNSFVWERLITIAISYEKGIITDEEIFELLLRRHSRGVSYYTYVLAGFYEKGRGTRKNMKKYIECVALCAHDGSQCATIELAECYEKGYGVRKYLKKAYELYRDYYDDHCRRDYLCCYKVAIYMLHGWGGAKKNMSDVKYYLAYAARVYEEARELHIELFNEDPVPYKTRK